MARADVKNLSFAQGEFMIDRVRVTASAPELNYNDGALPGQVVAEKSIVADTDGMVLGLRAPTEVITDNRVVGADESGLVLIADAADLNVTLPDTAVGFMVTVIVKTPSTTTGLKITPKSDDKIMGNGFTAADGKYVVNTAATDAVGDMMTLIGDGVDGWIVQAVKGTWAREG